MNLETIKWLDDCKRCGKVFNAKTLFLRDNGDEAEKYLKEEGFLPWTCECEKFNNLRN